LALETLIADLKVTRRQLELAGPLIVNRLAQVMVEELNSRVPDQSTNPGNTGTLRRVLTTRTSPIREGNTWVVYIGPLDQLGQRGVREYEPYPVKRFLEQYRKKQADEKKGKVEKRDKDREDWLQKQRAATAKRKQLRRADIEKGAVKLRADIEKLKAERIGLRRRETRLERAIVNYQDTWSIWESKGYELDKPSYQAFKQKWERAAQKLVNLRKRYKDIVADLTRLIEAEILYRQKHGL